MALRKQDVELRKEEVKLYREEARNQMMFFQEQLRMQQEEMRRNNQMMMQIQQQQQQMFMAMMNVFNKKQQCKLSRIFYFHIYFLYERFLHLVEVIMPFNIVLSFKIFSKYRKNLNLSNNNVLKNILGYFSLLLSEPSTNFR